MWLEASSAHVLAFHLYQLCSDVPPWSWFWLGVCFIIADYCGIWFGTLPLVPTFLLTFFCPLIFTTPYTKLYCVLVCPTTTTTTTFILCHLTSHHHHYHHHVDSSATQVWGHHEHRQQGVWQCTGLHRRLRWGHLVRLCRLLHLSHHHSVLHRLSVHNLETVRVALTPPAAGLEKEIWQGCEIWFLCSGFNVWSCTFCYPCPKFFITLFLPFFISFWSPLYLHLTPFTSMCSMFLFPFFTLFNEFCLWISHGGWAPLPQLIYNLLYCLITDLDLMKSYDWKDKEFSYCIP